MNTPLDPDEESRRLARLLAYLLKLDDRSIRSVEQELGLGSSALGKVLNGTIRLQMSHVLMILGVLDMPPGEFFSLAYPQKSLAPHRLVKEMARLQGPEGEESPQFEARVRRTLLRLLWELLRHENFNPLDEG
jgi:transcriptional regulator with XRE-family HTH domain